MSQRQRVVHMYLADIPAMLSGPARLLMHVATFKLVAHTRAESRGTHTHTHELLIEEIQRGGGRLVVCGGGRLL